MEGRKINKNKGNENVGIKRINVSYNVSSNDSGYNETNERFRNRESRGYVGSSASDKNVNDGSQNDGFSELNRDGNRRNTVRVNLSNRENVVKITGDADPRLSGRINRSSGQQLHADPRQRQPGPGTPQPVLRRPWRLRASPKHRPQWPSRPHSGRLGRLAASIAALSALAVLLPALLTSLAGNSGAVQGGSMPPAPPPAPPAAPQQAAAAAGGEAAVPAEPGLAQQPLVRVYLTHTGAIEKLPLEQYVTGVLAAEMPADFELAALKAQAIAARTFIAARLQSGDTSGVPADQADVLDTIEHQVYLSQAELDQWEEQGKTEQLNKLKQAVSSTNGVIMTYKGKPIVAAFFSASGGSTENSEDYWSQKVPYLRSVSSPWDARVYPNNKETVTINTKELFHRLGQQQPSIKASSNLSKLIQLMSTTAGGRVKEIKIGDHTYSGREVREKLELKSSQFNIQLNGDEAEITTYGNGHGVGMSQWGANGMAKEGYTATQILKHYYTGISFSNIYKNN